MKERRAAVAAVLAVVGLVAAGCSEPAEEAGVGAIVHVAGAWARSPTRDAAAVYFSAHNASAEADRLVGASSPAAARAEIRETVEVAGAMQRRPVAAVEIGPDEEVVFEPGGYHVMLLDLAEPLEVGSTVTVLLTFERAGDVPVEAIVRDPVPDDGMPMDDGEGM